MQEYKYSPLDPRSRAIRLLRVQHLENTSAHIILTLRHASLEPKHKFTALSYTWGEEVPNFAVTVQDEKSTGRFNVRKNLYEFLQTACHSSSDWSSDWMWIDQICINQQDHEERCQQVSQMGTLYSMAETVIVWTGLQPNMETPLSSVLQSNLTKPVFDSQTVDFISIEPHRSWDGTRPLSPSAIQLLNSFTYAHLLDLLQAPYWKRLWIVQELILAKEVHIILFGRTWALQNLWHSFEKINTHAAIVRNLEELRSTAEWFERRLVYFMSWRQTKELSRKRMSQEEASDSGWLNWNDALSICEGTECTMPLDRIYGLMGFVAENMRLPVDYDISQTQLLRDILKKHMESGGYSWDNRWDELFVIMNKWREHSKFDNDEMAQRSLVVLQNLTFKKDHEERRRRVEQVVRQILGELQIPIPERYTSIGEEADGMQNVY